MKRFKKILIASFLIISLVGLLAVSFTGCNKKSDKYVEKTVRYSLLNNETSVMGFDFALINGLLDSPSAREDLMITLTPEGNINIKIHLKDGAKINARLSSLLELLPGDILPISVTEDGLDLSALDLSDIIDVYAGQLFPGFDMKNVRGSLDLLKRTLGVEFTGIDWDSPAVKTVVNALETTGRFPSAMWIPDNGLCVEFNGKYEIRTITGFDVDENEVTYRAVCVGLQDIQEDPFLMFNFSKHPTTKVDTLIGHIKFLNFNFVGIKI